MVETNARILIPGEKIALPVRYVQVQATTATPELRERICYRLRQEHGLIAVPCQDQRDTLLVVTNTPMPTRRLHIDDWKVTLSDTGDTKLLTLFTSEGKQLLPELIERMITSAIEQRGLWWTYDSFRIWYEPQPFQVVEGIGAYRRYAVSVFLVEEVGVGVAVDVETAFFTQQTVAHFMDTRVSRDEQHRRRRQFKYLTRRQVGQQGTLLYDNGVKKLKCYFESMGNKSCGNTPPRRVRGKEYRSLVDYYQSISPALKIDASALAVFVSFPNLDHPQPVAAQCLRLRVMNEALPFALINVDKIAPDQRRRLLESFWAALGEPFFPQIQTLSSVPDTSTLAPMALAAAQQPTREETAGIENGGRTATLTAKQVDLRPVPLFKDDYAPPCRGANLSLFSIEELSAEAVVEDNLPALTFLPGFWRPNIARVRHIPFPTLYFGNGAVLKPPTTLSASAYASHYKQRLTKLEALGCYHFPPLQGRSLICAYPSEGDFCQAAEAMVNAACTQLQNLTGKPFDYQLVSYDKLEDAVAKLAQEKTPGTVLFVLNDESEAYAEVAVGLPDWRIKRITQDTLRKQYHNLTIGARGARGLPDKQRGQRFWDSFVQMTSLDLLQVMDAIPFRLDRTGDFEAQLVIDVSYDRRYYALSLLVARDPDTQAGFSLMTDTWQKADTKHEIINARILYDDIVRFVSQFIAPGRVAPLTSLLIPRDGRLVGEERAAIERAVTELKKRGCLTDEARIEIVELHKASEIHLRLWERNGNGSVANVLENTAVRLTSCMEILVTTGAGTLTQGTAEPLLVVASEQCKDVGSVTDALSAATHGNWSSPSVAQRLPLPFKRTDEELKARGEQEIRRIR